MQSPIVLSRVIRGDLPNVAYTKAEMLRELCVELQDNAINPTGLRIDYQVVDLAKKEPFWAEDRTGGWQVILTAYPD